LAAPVPDYGRPTPPDPRSTVEQRIARSRLDDIGVGRPLARRARRTPRTVEAYLRAGVVPRYMERLRDIDAGVRMQRRRIQEAYRALQEACGGDTERFAAEWRARARSWRFDALNEAIREHNEWYPVEAGLPMDPRTRDYVKRAGRSYRRPELGPEWVLEQFPAEPRERLPRRAHG
jgi:hypothetical protein